DITATDPFANTLPEPFRATIVPSASDLPTSLLLLTDTSLISGTVRQTLPNAVQVRAVKADGSSVSASVGVLFSSPQDVMFNPATAVTSGGAAATTVTFGCFVGRGSIRAALQAANVLPLTIPFTTTPGPAAQILKKQGDNQSGNPGQRLDGPGQALKVQITDVCGNPLTGQVVTWTVSPAGVATLESVFGTTDFEGNSSVLVRMGNRGGAFTVTASSGAFSTTFNLTVNILPTRLLLVSGDNQTVVLGQTAVQVLVVEVQDDNGTAAAGVEVTFTVTGGSATLGTLRTTTNAQGRASTTVQAGNILGAITVRAAAVGRTVTFTINTIGRVPVATTLGFVNSASFRQGWVPGSAGSIFGVGLMEGLTGVVLADRAPFPTNLRGVRVTVEGIEAPLISLVNISGQEQINLQVPANIPSSGTVTVVISNNGSSATFPGVRVTAVQPGIFEFPSGGTRLAAALHGPPDFSVVTQSNPARPGELILLFLTGLGATTPPVATNVAGPIPPAVTVTNPVVGINGEGAEVLGSFYAPSLYTAYQINFVIPANARSGLASLSVIADT
ncbi:MAG: hypothetical protein ACRD1B_09445, partial [Thermoanaerobaculia bacterium]